MLNGLDEFECVMRPLDYGRQYKESGGVPLQFRAAAVQ